jgi:hypothetical protein
VMVRLADWEVPLYAALIDAVWSVVTAFAVAMKVAVVEPAATVADTGTLRAALLLASDTGIPPAGAAFVRVIAQLAVAPPSRDAGAHVSDATCNCVVTVSEAEREVPFREAVTDAV